MKNLISIISVASLVITTILFANEQYAYMLLFLPFTMFTKNILSGIRYFRDHIFRFSQKDKIQKFNKDSLIVSNYGFEKTI